MTGSERLVRNVVAIIKANDNMKIGQVERECGLTRGYLSRYIRNKKCEGITLNNAIKLSEIVGYDLSDLIHSDYTNIGNELKAKKLEQEIERLRTEIDELRGGASCK